MHGVGRLPLPGGGDGGGDGDDVVGLDAFDASPMIPFRRDPSTMLPPSYLKSNLLLYLPSRWLDHRQGSVIDRNASRATHQLCEPWLGFGGREEGRAGREKL